MMQKIFGVLFYLAVVFGFAGTVALADERSPFMEARYVASTLILTGVEKYGFKDAHIDVARGTVTFVVDESLDLGIATMDGVFTSDQELEVHNFGDCYLFCKLSELTIFVSSEEEKKEWEEGLALAREKLSGLVIQKQEKPRAVPPPIP